MGEIVIVVALETIQLDNNYVLWPNGFFLLARHFVLSHEKCLEEDYLNTPEFLDFFE